MQQVITDSIEKIRDQLETLSEKGREELEQRRSNLKGKAQDARRSGEIAVLSAQVGVLEAARELLSWAGDRVEWGPLSKTEQALSDRIVGLRAANVVTLPIEDYDALSVPKVVEAIEASDLDEEALETIRAYEVDHKNRVTLLRELDARLAPPEVQQSA